ncbi:sodium:proton antiporter, partial [Vibrio agarivorans]
MSAVVLSVTVLVVLTIMRLNIVASIVISSFLGGIISGQNPSDIWTSFTLGLGNNASLAL